MKLYKTLLILTTLMMSFQGTAFQMSQDINCPSISDVRNVTFTKADKMLFLGKYVSWLLTSSEFIHNNQVWSVAVKGEFPHASNEREALAQGGSYFQETILSNPYSHTKNRHTFCIYAKASDGINDYVIGAVTPAIHAPIPSM